MLTKDLILKVDEAIVYLSSLRDLRVVKAALSADSQEPLIIDILNRVQSDAAVHLKQALRSMFPPEVITESITGLIEAEYRLRNPDFMEYNEPLSHSREELLLAIRALFGGDSLAQFWHLYTAARTFFDATNAAIAVLQQVKNQISLSRETTNNDMSIVFRTDHRSLGHIVAQLGALNEIYSELCRLLFVSTSEHPLLVDHLEIGSLWVKLFGEGRVIKLMADLAENTAKYLYRNFTVEGKLSTVPGQLETAGAFVDLAAKLKKAGMDASVIEAEIVHTSAFLAKRYRTLLAGEPTVEVNDQELSVGLELSERYLETTKGLLEDGGRSTTNNEEPEVD